MIGDWQPYLTVGQTYMRRSIFWLFWQTRPATDDEIIIRWKNFFG